MSDITVVSAPIFYSYGISGTPIITYRLRDPSLDITFNCLDYDNASQAEQGVIKYSYDISGALLGIYFVAPEISYSYNLSGSARTTLVVRADPIIYSYGLSSDRLGVTLKESYRSWIAWSKIGQLDFSIDSSNSSGYRPMDFPGEIYAILKKDRGVVIYGENGIRLSQPAGLVWGLAELLNEGTKGKGAQVNCEGMHFFITRAGHLYSFGDQLARIGYSEFLAALVNPVMSYDGLNKLIYIADGTRGFVYSIREGSLSKGPVNATSFSYRDATSYLWGPAAIAKPTIGFTTEILDFGTRKSKTIFSVEASMNVDAVTSVRIAYRNDVRGSFSLTPWANFVPSGFAYLPCYGKEFMVSFSCASWQTFKIDMFKINGVIEGFSFLDTARRER
jgi:hypothetical protein